MEKGLSSNLVNYYLSYTKQGCKNPESKWGSQKPIKENCIPTHMKGVPCTNIWNNNTRRKIIVNK